jgi:flagellar hook-length control protein FliK
MDPAVELDRSARVLSGSTGPGRWNVSLRLDPPDLGEMRVQVRLQQSAMTLRIETESAAVGQLVESRLRELRDSLAVHGLRVDRTEIVVRSPEANAGFAEHSRQEAGEQEQHRGSDAQERPHENWADQANFDNANEEVASGEESAVGARQGEDLEVSGRIGSEVDGLWTSTSLNLVA